MSSLPTAREGNVFRSVCLSTWGICLQRGVCLQMGGLPLKGGWLVLTSNGGHFSGRYASYLNAFLLQNENSFVNFAKLWILQLPLIDDFFMVSLQARKAKRLKEFSTSQLLEALINRKKLHKCHCGAIFQDIVLYHLHRGNNHHHHMPLPHIWKFRKREMGSYETKKRKTNVNVMNRNVPVD